MDFNALQHKLFALDPTDPKEDLARLRAQAQGSAGAPVKESVDYLQESVAVPEGSLQMDRNYSVDDFAALAGVVTEKKQRTADQVRGSEPMPKAKPGRTDHPYQDRLVGDSIDYDDTMEGLRVIQTGQPNNSPASAQGQQTVQQLTQRLQQTEQRLQKVEDLLKRLQSALSQTGQAAQTVTQSKKYNKQPLESIDSIKDSLYAALNKKMGN